MFFFFPLLSFFLKSYENEQVDLWSPGMVVSHASCAFSFGASERYEGQKGQEAPCKHLDLGWVRAGVGQSQGSRLEKWVALHTQALGDAACAPLPPQNKTLAKKPEHAQEEAP